MESSLETLSCNNCGAPLQVPSTTNFVACNHCGAQLAVRRNETATFTEAVAKIDEHAQSMNEHLAELRRQNDLAQLDREWDRERESFMVSGRKGHRHVPSQVGSIIGGSIVVIFGIIWTSVADGPGLFGIVAILLGIGGSAYGIYQAGRYRDAERRYRLRRSQLLRADNLPGTADLEAANDRSS